MPMPDDTHSLQAWSPLARSLASWTVLFMGWVWLGEQGQRLGWSTAGGVAAVALWWAVRLVLAGPGWGTAWSARTTALAGTVTCTGVMMIELGVAGPGAHALLLTVATVWAFWSAALAKPGQIGTSLPAASFERVWRAGTPGLAATLVWLALASPAGQPARAWCVACLLLAAVCMVAFGRTAPHATTGTRIAPPAHALSSGSVLSSTAMGLMMGSLWMGTAWCAGLGWPQHTVVGLHLLTMATLPFLMQPMLTHWRLSTGARHALSLALLVLAAVLLQSGSQASPGVAGMALLAAAWTIHALPCHARVGAPRNLTWRWLPLGGPALLLAVGHGSITLGPQALVLAYGLLGALALAALLERIWRAAHHAFQRTWAFWRNAT